DSGVRMSQLVEVAERTPSTGSIAEKRPLPTGLRTSLHPENMRPGHWRTDGEPQPEGIRDPAVQPSSGHARVPRPFGGIDRQLCSLTSISRPGLVEPHDFVTVIRKS